MARLAPALLGPLQVSLDGQPVTGFAYNKVRALLAYREEAHRRLMRLLAGSGQRSAALAQYETCRRLLADELNWPRPACACSPRSPSWRVSKTASGC